ALHDEVECAAVQGDTIIAGIGGDSYFSTDAGANWSNGDRPAIQPSDLGNVLPIDMLFAPSGDLLTGTTAGVYQSSNLGVSWSPVGLQEGFIRILFRAGDHLYAITQKGIYRSGNNAGTDWNIIAKTAQDSIIAKDSLIGDITYSASDSTIYIVSANHGINKS